MKPTTIKKAKKVSQRHALSKAIVGERNLNRTLITHLLVLINQPDSEEAGKIREYYGKKYKDATTPTDPAAVN